MSRYIYKSGLVRCFNLAFGTSHGNGYNFSNKQLLISKILVQVLHKTVMILWAAFNKKINKIIHPVIVDRLRQVRCKTRIRKK